MARKMKDSGIEWIGEIPEGWEIVKIKYGVTKVGSGKTPSGGAEVYTDCGVLFLRSQNIYDCSLVLDNPSYISYETDLTMKSTRILPNDILLNITGASIGRCCVVPETLGPANVNQHVCIIRTNPEFFLPKFMQYFWVSHLGRYAISLFQTGGNREGLSFDAIRNTPIPYISIPEQSKIITYLDSECSRIDVMLSKTRSSIEEYKKLKQAVITQAVTKGVRGEREMKDSGVEWIGKIPREFDPVQLKFFCKLITDGTHFSPTTVENGWPYITAGDVHGIGLDYNSAKRISEEDFQLLVAQGCQPLKGDVLLVKDGATTGRVGFVDSDTPCVILSSVAMLRPADNTDGHYLMYLLASDFLQKQILVSMAGSAMPRTTLTKLTKYIGLLPPLHEQKEIANYLDAKCAEIDGLIAKKEQLVKELESYKKSLIYEVVTGKREV